MKLWQHWKYKHLTFFAISIIIVVLLTRIDAFHQILTSLGNYGYLGAIFAGMLFVSTYTVSIGALVLVILAEKLNPIEIAIAAGVGAVVVDYTIFRIIKDSLMNEIEDIYTKFGGNHLSHLFHTKYLSWSLPVIGALIIASPLPDEIGVGLMGIAKMKTYKFIIISFILNSIGIFLAVSASALFNTSP